MEEVFTKYGTKSKKGFPVKLVRVISETRASRKNKPRQGYKKVEAIIEIAGHQMTRHCEIKA
jgi:hypothetical protein